MRGLAAFLMIFGVFSFVAVLIFLGDQPLLLGFTTLIAISGAGLLYRDRKFAAAPLPAYERDAPLASANPWETLSVDSPSATPATLLTKTIAAFENSLKATVSIESEQAGRAILQIRLPGGQATAFVHDSPQAVDVSELRALFALASSRNCRVAYSITAGDFTPRALVWSQGRGILLIAHGRVEQIR